jgi:hypothetical protein
MQPDMGLFYFSALSGRSFKMHCNYDKYLHSIAIYLALTISAWNYTIATEQKCS